MEEKRSVPWMPTYNLSGTSPVFLFTHQLHRRSISSELSIVDRSIGTVIGAQSGPRQDPGPFWSRSIADLSISANRGTYDRLLLDTSISAADASLKIAKIMKINSVSVGSSELKKVGLRFRSSKSSPKNWDWV